MKERITSRDKYEFLVTFLSGVITHLYVMTNKLPAYDDLDCVRSFGGGVSLGRWLLEVLGLLKHKLLGNYSSPAFNGVLSLFFIAVAVVLFCRIFDIESKAWQTLTGILFAVFPVLTGYMIYMYTSYYYCFALMLLMIGVYIFRTCQKVSGILLSICCMAGAIGIYQAYLPFLVSILLIILLIDTTKNNATCKSIVKYGVSELVVIFGGLFVYSICNKVLQLIMHAGISGMKGSDRVGSVLFDKGIAIIPYIYQTFTLPLTQDYYGLTGFIWMRLVFGIVYIMSIICVVLLVMKTAHDKNYAVLGLQILIVLLIPLGIHSLYAMAEEQYFYTLMFYTDVLLLLLPMILLENVHKIGLSPRIDKYMSIVLSIVLGFSCLFYVNQDNATYLQMDYAISGTRAYYTTLLTQIKSVEGYNPSYPVILAGSLEDPTLFDLQDAYFEQVNIGGAYGTEDMVKRVDLNLFFKQYLGYDQCISRDASQVDSDKLKMMPFYPMPGSIQVIDKKIVVKFSNE
jgi:hypothetical protein